MTRILITILAALLYPISAIASDGMLSIKSAHSVDDTTTRLESILKEKGMTLFNQVDHAAGAKNVGHELRPTRLMLFGNPKVGSPLMLCEQTIAIDLPQKALIWEDENQQVWISYNDPAYLKNRHQVEGCDPVFNKVTQALKGILGKAAQP